MSFIKPHCGHIHIFIFFIVALSSSCTNAYPIAHALPQTVNRNTIQTRGLYGQKWILDTYDKSLQDADRKVFETTLTDVPVGSRIHNDGANNRAMFSLSSTYKDHPATDLIMKVLHGTPDDNAFVEVKVLRESDDLIASGMLHDAKLSKTPIPVIIMKRKPGKILSKTSAYKKASFVERKRMEKEAVQMMCEKVTDFAQTKHILRLDNKEQNALVTMTGKTVTSVELVDMGPPGIYSISNDAGKDEIMVFCIRFASNIFVSEN